MPLLITRICVDNPVLSGGPNLTKNVSPLSDEKIVSVREDGFGGYWIHRDGTNYRIAMSTIAEVQAVDAETYLGELVDKLQELSQGCQRTMPVDEDGNELLDAEPVPPERSHVSAILVEYKAQAPKIKRLMDIAKLKSSSRVIGRFNDLCSFIEAWIAWGTEASEVS